MPDGTYPAGLSELDFVESYLQSTLRKPQVAADAALRTLVTAGTGDRILLTALIAEQLAEAGRRLVAVHDALADRTHPIARLLLRPLPGAQRWVEFSSLAARLEPGDMTRRLGIGDAGLESARQLRARPDLALVADLVRAAEGGSLMPIVPVSESGRAPTEFWLAGAGQGGEVVAIPFAALESDAAGLADFTADLSGIARGFLGAYLEARRGAGRRD